MAEKKKRESKVINMKDRKEAATSEDGSDVSPEEMEFHSVLIALHDYIGSGDYLLNRLEKIVQTVFVEEGDSKLLQDILENWVVFRQSFIHFLPGKYIG